jgi:hypothetical protein
MINTFTITLVNNAFFQFENNLNTLTHKTKAFNLKNIFQAILL